MVDQELLQALRMVVKEEVTPLTTRMDKLDSRMDTLDTRMKKLEQTMLRVEATQEVKVLPGLSLLAEGHENIVEHIQEKIDARADKLQDSIDVLSIAVKYHSEDIQELKKAQ